MKFQRKLARRIYCRWIGEIRLHLIHKIDPVAHSLNEVTDGRRCFAAPGDCSFFENSQGHKILTHHPSSSEILISQGVLQFFLTLTLSEIHRLTYVHHDACHVIIKSLIGQDNPALPIFY
jgi:hypothetical protein